MKKRLYKSGTDKKWSGVCAGIAEYFDLDPVLIRALYAFLTIITGVFPGLVSYLVLAWIIPNRNEAKLNG